MDADAAATQRDDALVDGITRRGLLKALASGVGAFAALPALPLSAWAEALHVREQTASAGAGAATFFTPAEREAVTALVEVIVPADDRSGGAAAAGVPDFIDALLAGRPEDARDTWRQGLAALDETSRRLFGKTFAGLTPGQQISLVADMSRGETSPSTPLERLFVEAKTRTIQGYYTSEIGIHQELGYKGNQFLQEFVGCTHPEHQ
jgi:hypothetical protein